jgi:SAM-dependent methyltransferase
MPVANFARVAAENIEHHKPRNAARPASSPLETEYALDNAAPQAGDRFDALCAIFDPGTISHFDRLGLTGGWHCLEVGGGSGSIAAWLSERVGPTGRVVVTDINTRFLDAIKRPNMEVCQHDIVNDPLPEGAFDLVHARLVLMHLPRREEVLARLVKALKPGGWLLDEEFDLMSQRADPKLSPAEEVLNAETAFYRVLRQKGVELSFGRILFARLRALGLVDVSAEGWLSMWTDGSAGAALLRSNLEQLSEAMIQSGYITAEQLARDMARLDDPNFVTPSPTLWAVQGRRPQSLHAPNQRPVSGPIRVPEAPCGWSVL